MVKIEENVSLKPFHTFHIEAFAKYFVEYDTEEELLSLLSSDLLKGNKFLHIGGGSNLLFTKDYDGVILHSRMRQLDIVAENSNSVYVSVKSGEVFDNFVSYAVSKGWGGIENLSHIPGEVGASAVQNVGAYGVEAKDVIESVRCIDIETKKIETFSKKECRYSYRNSIFKQEFKGRYIITAVTFRLNKYPDFKLDYGNLRAAVGDNPTLMSVRKAIIDIRRKKLPEPDEIGSAGSFFVNPTIDESACNRLKSDYPDMPVYPLSEGKKKLSAAWLIDRAGGHGKKIGGAAIYPHQCLVIVNQNNATAADVVNLAETIRAAVYKKFGIDIKPEVNYI